MYHRIFGISLVLIILLLMPYPACLSIAVRFYDRFDCLTNHYYRLWTLYLRNMAISSICRYQLKTES